jgi:hypothetical protein
LQVGLHIAGAASTKRRNSIPPQATTLRKYIVIRKPYCKRCPSIESISAGHIQDQRTKKHHTRRNTPLQKRRNKSIEVYQNDQIWIGTLIEVT